MRYVATGRAVSLVMLHTAATKIGEMEDEPTAKYVALSLSVYPHVMGAMREMRQTLGNVRISDTEKLNIIQVVLDGIHNKLESYNKEVYNG